MIMKGTCSCQTYGVTPASLLSHSCLTLVSILSGYENSTLNGSSAAGGMTPCGTLVSELQSWSGQFIRRLQNFTLDWRLGNMVTTGKVSARNAVALAFQVGRGGVRQSAGELAPA